MTTKVLTISGMTCEHCARTIEDALNTLPSVRAAVSYATHRAEVELADATDKTMLIERYAPRATTLAHGVTTGRLPSRRPLQATMAAACTSQSLAAAAAPSRPRSAPPRRARG